EDILGQENFLEVVGFGRVDLLVRRNAAAAVDRPPGVGQLDLLVGLVRRQRSGVVVVVVVKRDALVVALDQTARRRVVVIGGQRQAGVLAEVIDGLHQSLAEGGLPHNQCAVVILQCAAYDLRRGGCS